MIADDYPWGWPGARSQVSVDERIRKGGYHAEDKTCPDCGGPLFTNCSLYWCSECAFVAPYGYEDGDWGVDR